jgi:hypothetical protein
MPDDPFGEEWERWRIMLILHAVPDETLRIANAGIDRTLIYGHQTQRIDDCDYADDLMTATAANGAGGVRLYGKGPSDLGAIDNPLRASGRNNWGNFELNPLSSNSTFSYIAIETLWNDGVEVSNSNK